MSIIKKSSARYQSLGKEGKGYVSTESGVLSDQPYGFNTRFEGKAGTNPEELIAAAHASCFTMALSFALESAGYKEGELETECAISLDKEGEGFKVSQSSLTLKASIEGISETEFSKIAEKAKTGCPISKLLDAEITLNYTLS
ncbi:OsmC family protein [Neptunomonas phycophila]|jgi:osmotically inducible protein OsmC|uniref:OsmC family protein n=1 Tax=Neptunomonas phycophila TaxID=1572645 RepID=A0AAW7XM87_9GAMM|nr:MULTISPECIES: OsmC family protein [Neptunomonas]MDN2658753.1 OsmC family protein [Neptunomonas sp. CHC150]MDO6454797.1 OsmC family protein [Neptunomonas phycophila]MDO6469053.1 OsmC family protein [Neptunomonas phycophila]MDO6785075.1 OsmC family protein [Neptunomonas phycophila]MDP2522620.1 OsmC family protein [Neptunomonas phycophila]